MQDIVGVAKKAARLAAQEILTHWDHLTIEFKGVNDVVTQADVAAERVIAQTIFDAFPDHGFYGEETATRPAIDSRCVWLVDPIDGTTNFASKLPHFSISIAYAELGVVRVGVVYDVVRDEMFHGILGEGAFLNDVPISVSATESIQNAVVCTGFSYERGPLMRATLKSIERLFDNNLRGIRRFGSAALDLCWVACGRLDGFFEYILKPWDFAAGALIVTEAGGHISTHTATPFDLAATGVIAATPKVFGTLQSLTKYGE